MPMRQVAPLLITALYQALQDTYTAIMTHHDDKALHDFRVALRRTRAVLREMRCVDQDSWQPILQTARRIARSTNLIRDVDVCRADILHDDTMPSSSAPGRALLRHLTARKARAVQLANKQLLLVPEAVLQPLRKLTEKNMAGPCATSSFQEMALRITRKRSAALLRGGSKLKPKSAAKKYHQVRIQAKRLRYTLETMAPAMDSAVLEQLLGSLKKLQNNLGALQDCAVQEELLAVFAARPRTNDPEAVVQFVKMRRQGLRQRRQALRQEFGTLFAQFAQLAHSLAF